ncbi:MAG: dihydrodipicolinate synthase family protein [Gammaproteobacteria bacterium]|nr:dihydrodipicolinate synthase family protein [Pseudomonadales bacterium]MCP5346921.1 dihydrodipicolinate synthase family protein [Pseudomonadales bacterium]
MPAERFSGVLAPVVTPFDNQLNPDPGRLVQHCRWLLSQGARLAVFGTNSEANSLSVEEKIHLLDMLVDQGIEPASMMPGTGCCALTDTVRLTRHAVELGCAGVLMLPPFYYKGVSDAGLFASYSEVVQRVGSAALQVYLYHIPPLTQVPLSLALVERLVSAYPDTIAGIKDSSGDWQNTRALLEAGWDNFRVFCGSESFLLATLRGGGAGCISATANVNPGPIDRLWRNWQAADAEAGQQALDATREFFQGFSMIAALKATLAHYRGDPEWNRVRPPLLTLPEQQLQSLLTGLQKQAFQMPDLSRFP